MAVTYPVAAIIITKQNIFEGTEFSWIRMFSSREGENQGGQMKKGKEKEFFFKLITVIHHQAGQCTHMHHFTGYRYKR
jgi:hypothetical protein